MTTDREPQPHSQPTKLRPYTRPHVLIVTSNPDLAEFLSEGLTMRGFWTSTVSSSIQVLEVFRLRSFDLVLVDAALSGMGGLEVVRRLRGRSARVDPGAARTDVPILVIAATTAEATEEDAIRAGADRFLPAPIEIDDLAYLLFTQLEEWRQRHPDRPFADEMNFSAGEGKDS